MVGTGRCGSQFLYALLQDEPSLAPEHEPFAVAEAFQRYARFNKLAVDSWPLIAAIRQRAIVAGDFGRLFVEVSAWLSLHVPDLHDALDARLVLLVRNPFDTVRSLLKKGWYSEPYVRENDRLALGYHELGQPHYGFSRIAPRGDDAQPWEALTRAGKCAWYWNVINKAVLTAFARLPCERRRVIKVEDLTFHAYTDLVHFLGVDSTTSPQSFRMLAKSRPGRLDVPIEPWSTRESAEIIAQVSQTAERLGYDVSRKTACVQPGISGQQGRSRAEVAPGPPRSPGRLEAGSLIVTLGAFNQTAEDVGWMVQHGIRAFRVNLGRFSRAHNERLLDAVECAKRNERVVMLVDLPGAKVRLGRFANGPRHRVEEGRDLRLVCADDQMEPDSIPVRTPEFFGLVQAGTLLSFSGSSAVLETLEAQPDRVKTRVLRSGLLTKQSGIWLSGPYKPCTALWEQDKELLRQLRYRATDFIALSFADTPQLVQEARRFAIAGQSFIAKLESPWALVQAPALLSAADGLMIGRDDLARHLTLDVIDEWLVAHATDGVSQNKPVITASQYVAVDDGRGTLNRSEPLITALRLGLGVCLSETGSIVNWREVVADAITLSGSVRI